MISFGTYWFSWAIAAFAGLVTLVVLAVRRALEGRSGVDFADLGTAAIVGVAVGIGPLIMQFVAMRSFRRNVHVTQIAEERSPARGPATPSSAEARGSTGRFDKFSERARKVLTLAQDEAQRFNHNYIGTEHLLLGLVREGEGVAAHVLTHEGIELPKVRTAVEFIIGRGDKPVVGEVGLTPRAKRVIELSIDEARQLGDHYIGTEHLLLGLLREGEGIAAGVLLSLGADLERMRHDVMQVRAEGGAEGV
jgi:ClpA/ClpB-like protein